eukprot:Skav228981  [mRNA]  locus=scaffold1053:18296:19147:+ [translate_table: standard]
MVLIAWDTRTISTSPRQQGYEKLLKRRQQEVRHLQEQLPGRSPGHQAPQLASPAEMASWESVKFLQATDEAGKNFHCEPFKTKVFSSQNQSGHAESLATVLVP